MANLTGPRVLEFIDIPEKKSAKCTASTTYYRGSILCFSASTGYLVKPTDVAATYGAGVFDGIAEDGVEDYSFACGATQKRLELKVGRVWVPLSGAAQTDVGQLAYLADDNLATKTAGSKTIAYLVEDFKTGYVLLDLRKPIKAA
jgi:hypothetical protein